MAIGIGENCGRRGFRRGAKRHHGVLRHPLRGAAGGGAALAPPKPAPAWEGVRDCTRFGNMCAERRVRRDGCVLNHPQSEDCLYLNIWTPANAAGEDLPVHFWIHGGGLSGRPRRRAAASGAAARRAGEILVTINYRLGALGFLAHPALTAEDEKRRVRQLRSARPDRGAALGEKEHPRVRRRPNRIAIAGQSAGAMSVAALLASPLTAGLYSAAVLQSGGPRPGARTKAEAEAHGLEIQKKLGCASIEEMRAKPVEDILPRQGRSRRAASPARCGQLCCARTRTARFLRGASGRCPF